MHRFLSYALTSLVVVSTAACAAEGAPDIEITAAGEPVEAAADGAAEITLAVGESIELEALSHLGPNATPASLSIEPSSGIELVAAQDDAAETGRFVLYAQEPGSYWAIATDPAASESRSLSIVVLGDESLQAELMEAPDQPASEAAPANGAVPHRD